MAEEDLEGNSEQLEEGDTSGSTDSAALTPRWSSLQAKMPL